MEQIRNVIVFGDSLSDIGTKWKSASGKFAKKTGAMTVSPSGRFSDCRNWTDFMYEEAAGTSLVLGNAKDTIDASKSHLRLGQNSGWLNTRVAATKRFFYANYAEGGACGGIPAMSLAKPALGTFKDQVKRYIADFNSLYATPKPSGLVGVDWSASADAKLTLFLVWFGANDLYTAQCAPTAMAGVAEKVANKRRHELSRLVGAKNARFIFMNLARPEASVRYQELYEQQKGTKMDRFKKFFGGGIEKQLDKFRQGADLFNARLQHYAVQNGDVVVDIASVVHPDVMASGLKELGLMEGSQSDGTSKTYVPARIYDDPKLKKQLLGKTQHVTTSDKAHPTDQVYKVMWSSIRFTILQRQYAFGNLGGVPA